MRKRYLASHNGYDGYMCGFHQKMGRNYCELNHITFEKLDELVVFAIIQQLKQMRNDLKNPDSCIELKKMETGRKIAWLEAKIEKNTLYRKKTYEQFMDDILSEEEYLKLIQIYKNENKQYRKELQKLKNTGQEQMEAIKDTEKWLENFNQRKLTVKQLTKEVLVELVDRIYVYSDQKIDIYFKFVGFRKYGNGCCTGMHTTLGFSGRNTLYTVNA